MGSKRVLAACLLACIATAGAVDAVPLDPAFTEQVQYTGLAMVTGMAWAPDGSDRLFVITKAGEIRIIEGGSTLPTPFATVAPIRTSSECGLIGMAFHPSFASNGYLYVFVTVSLTEQRILRFTANGNVGEDQQIIVANLPTRGANHNGGGIGIGPDGKLYWAVGDTGDYTGVNDDLLTLAAKVGRANLDGSIPTDNPFHDGDGPNDDYIWARGFRNPFTLTFQPSTERLWVNTVGTVYEQIFTPQAGSHAGYNKYEGNQPAGFLQPTILYRTGLVDMRTIASATRSAGVATYTTPGFHRFQPGTKITITGVADASFNTTAYVASVPTSYTFTLHQPGPDASSAGGAITGFQWGSAVTGGAFWDSSGAPPTHLGDFFFGDYVSGRILRAEIGDGVEALAVDEWADTVPSAIDVDVGPDGNLYFIGHNGELYRTSYNGFTEQALVVSRLHLRTFEGGATAFNVRLAVQPSTDRVVTVERTEGDRDVEVSEGASLLFTPTNWTVPQRVLLAVGRDQDLVDDEATIAVSSPNLTTQTVRVRVTDDGPADALGAAGANAGGAPNQGAPGGPSDGAESGGEGGHGSVDGGAPSATGEAASGGAASGNTPANGGATEGGAPSRGGPGSSDASCGCRAVGNVRASYGALSAALALLGAGLMRRRQRMTPRLT